jgi:hypothetical protein
VAAGCFDEVVLASDASIHHWFLIGLGWAVRLTSRPDNPLPTSIRADILGQAPNTECA